MWGKCSGLVRCVGRICSELVRCVGHGFLIQDSSIIIHIQYNLSPTHRNSSEHLMPTYQTSSEHLCTNFGLAPRFFRIRSKYFILYSHSFGKGLSLYVRTLLVLAIGLTVVRILINTIVRIFVFFC